MCNGQLYLCVAEHEWSDQLVGCIWGVSWHQVSGELPAMLHPRNTVSLF